MWQRRFSHQWFRAVECCPRSSCLNVSESSKVGRSVVDESGTAAGPSVSLAAAERAKFAVVSTDFHGVKKSAKFSPKCDAPSHKTSSARVSSNWVPSEEDITAISADFHEVKKSAKFSRECDAPSHKASSARVSSSRVPSEEDIPSPLRLYWTLVDQGILPAGSEDDFLKFGEAWMQAAEREDQRRCKWDNVGAATARRRGSRPRQQRRSTHRTSSCWQPSRDLPASVQDFRKFSTRAQPRGRTRRRK